MTDRTDRAPRELPAPARLAGFAALLAVVFAAALLLGSRVGVDTPPAQDHDGPHDGPHAIASPATTRGGFL